MKTITLDFTKHKGKRVLLFKFPYDNELRLLIRQLPNTTWSATHRSFYAPYTVDLIFQAKELFNSIAVIDDTELLKKQEAERNSPPDIRNFPLNEEANEKLERFKQWMQSRRYSGNTIKTYTESLKTLFRYYSNKTVADISNDDIIRFNNEYLLANKFSSSFQNQVVNAIKLYFTQIEQTSINIDRIHRPKRENLLPNVLSKEEVKKILQALSNVKHKAILSLIYACGLRRNELLRLKVLDVDSKRKLLIIRQSKGRKDRIAPLSDKIIALLREYYLAYKPTEWLFEGQDKKSQYDESSLASVLKQAIEKAEISKKVTLHWLRHSYATHLLENGTDLRYIQEILGHRSSRTTEIYTHVSNQSIQKIISPFDSL